MPLNIVSNYASNVAQRHLRESDMQATQSVAKLSAGTRVLSAKDDAAASAIGSRLSAEVGSLQQASVNAGQAVSMLQIADGAMSRTQDILVRMKTLAVQSSSGQLTNDERGMLDKEFQELGSEITRIAQDTEFNGTQLLNGKEIVTGKQTTALGTANASVAIDSTNGITAPSGAEKFTVAFTAGANNTTAGTFTLTFLNAENNTVGTAVTASASTNSSGSDVSVAFGSTGISVTLANGFQSNATPGATAAYDLTNGTSGSGNLDRTFKVGTGTDAQDSISVSVGAINETALGINSDSISTTAGANTAITNIDKAIDTIAENRAELGAKQNRLEFASANIATSMENTEAARSSLMDLDIASEMSNFTSKQLLVQAGVAMLSQANQLPQGLTRLLG